MCKSPNGQHWSDTSLSLTDKTNIRNSELKICYYYT